MLTFSFTTIYFCVIKFSFSVVKKYLDLINKTIMTRVLIVGAGITGAVTASLLKCRLPQNSHIAVWEMCSGAGDPFGDRKIQQE